MEAVEVDLGTEIKLRINTTVVRVRVRVVSSHAADDDVPGPAARGPRRTLNINISPRASARRPPFLRANILQVNLDRRGERGRILGRQHRPDDRRMQITALPQSGDAGRGL